MITDLLALSCTGSTNPVGVTITLNLDNGTFVVNGLNQCVFYGVAPGYEGNNYPATQVLLSNTQVQYTGNINSVYHELYAQVSDDVLTGTLSADPPLPVEVSLYSYAGGGSATLPPNTASIDIQIPIANDSAAHTRRASPQWPRPASAGR